MTVRVLLLLVMALLVPPFAHAANPSATLSVQIVPGGSNNPPAPPAAAQVAGFTICVICFDWTAASGGVWVNGTAVAGANAAQTNTWLDCAGAGSPHAWQYAKFLGGNRGTVASGMPCPDITADGAGNSRVLHIVMPPVPVDNANGFELYDSGTGQGVKVPTNNYVEVTYWVPAFPSTAFSAGLFLGGAGEITPAEHNYLEFDLFEINTPTAGGQSACTHSWADGTTAIGCNWYGSNPPNYSGYDPRSGYHVVAERTTSDGSTTLYRCMWLDSIFQNCIHGTVSGNAILADKLSDARSRMETYYHPAGGPLFGRTTTTDMVTYTTSLRVWACANWQATACSTPGNPDPGGF